MSTSKKEDLVKHQAKKESIFPPLIGLASPFELEMYGEMNKLNKQIKAIKQILEECK